MIREFSALSVRQPWAWVIADGHKPVENRSRRTHKRGLILIHAPLTFDHGGEAFIRQLMPELIMKDERFQLGGIIGCAEIVDCVEESESPWFFGRFGYVLANAKPLPFMPCKGKLGFFKVDYDDENIA